MLASHRVCQYTHSRKSTTPSLTFFMESDARWKAPGTSQIFPVLPHLAFVPRSLCNSFSILSSSPFKNCLLGCQTHSVALDLVTPDCSAKFTTMVIMQIQYGLGPCLLVFPFKYHVFLLSLSHYIGYFINNFCTRLYTLLAR